MSVKQAILFYSKKDKKSSKLKNLIDNMNIDINYISVDHSVVRERLKDNADYTIDRVPSILLVQNSGEYQVLIEKELDSWFEQLLENIQSFYQQQQQQKVVNEGTTSILDEADYVEITPKKQVVESGIGQMSPVEASMVKEHIRESSSDIQREAIKPVRKEVKNENISPTELAKQIAQQREALDEKLEEAKPFI